MLRSRVCRAAVCTLADLPLQTRALRDREHIPNAVILKSRSSRDAVKRVRSNAEFHRLVMGELAHSPLQLADLVERTNPVIAHSSFLKAAMAEKGFHAAALAAGISGGDETEPFWMTFVPSAFPWSQKVPCDDALMRLHANEALRLWFNSGKAQSGTRRQGHLQVQLDGGAVIDVALHSRAKSVEEVLADRSRVTYLPLAYHNDSLYLHDTTARAVEAGMIVVVDKQRGSNVEHAEAIKAAWEAGFDVALPEFPIDKVNTEPLAYQKTCGALVMGHLLVHFDQVTAAPTVSVPAGSQPNPIIHVTNMFVINDVVGAQRETDSIPPLRLFCRQLAQGAKEFEVRHLKREGCGTKLMTAALPFPEREVASMFDSLAKDLQSPEKLNFALLRSLEEVMPNFPARDLFHSFMTPPAIMAETNLAASPPITRHTRARELDLVERAKAVLLPALTSERGTALGNYREADRRGKSENPSYAVDPRAESASKITPAATFAELYQLNELRL